MMQNAYCLLPPDANADNTTGMRIVMSEEPISPERIEETLGGPYELIGPGIDGSVIAVLKDREQLPTSLAYPFVNGPVLLGKYDATQRFVGNLQVGY